jgi:DNA-directed RNA polymerase subunit RPC12/RpoP
MATLQTSCEKCGRWFYFVREDTRGKYPFYCPDCDSRVKLAQNRERVRRHRKANRLREESGVLPVKEQWQETRNEIPRPDYSRAQEYIRSEEFAQHLEKIIAPLSEEAQMFWREKFRKTVGLE